MNEVGHSERQTQNRVIALLRDELHYRYIGDWRDRERNGNNEEALLSRWLGRRSHAPEQVSWALHKLRVEADNPNRNLYENNR